MAQLSNYLERLRCPSLNRPDEGRVSWSSCNLFGQTQLLELDFSPNSIVLEASEMEAFRWKIAFSLEDGRLVVTEREGEAIHWPKTKGKLIEKIQEEIASVDANPVANWAFIHPSRSPYRAVL